MRDILDNRNVSFFLISDRFKEVHVFVNSQLNEISQTAMQGGDQTLSVNRYNYSHIFCAVSFFAQKRLQWCRKSLKLPGFDDSCSLKWRKTDTAVKNGDDTLVGVALN